MSRVELRDDAREGPAEMTAAVRTALNGLLAQLAMQAGVKRDAILELAIVGNPIMHHLVLGHRPDPARLRAVRARDRPGGRRSGPRSWTSPTHPGARVYVLPCIAGHVGADTAGVILAEAPHQSEVVELVVDVGTNAEIVLGNRYFLLAASSPTGPGVRGRPDLRRPARGAGRDRAGPDRPRDAGAAVPGHRRRAVVGRAGLRRGDAPRPASPGSAARGIVEVIAELFLAGVITPDGIVDGSLAARTPRIVAGRPDVLATSSTTAPPRAGRGSSITQNDVRAIQLAKAALYAGVRLLMDHAGIETVDEIRLAGAFGSQIDPFHAMVLGLIPDAAAEPRQGRRQRRRDRRPHRAAQRARRGARSRASCGRSRRSRPRSSRGSRSTSSRRWRSPTGSAPSPNLSAVVDLPRPTDGDGSGGRGGEPRRRRRAAPTATRDPHPRGTTDDRRPLPDSAPAAATPAARPASTPSSIARAVPDPDAGPVRGPRRGGPRDHRAQRRHDPRGGRARVPRRPRRARAAPKDAGADVTGRAGPLPARHAPPDRPGDRAAPVHPVRPQRGEQRPDRRDRTPSSPRTTARRSSATSTTAGATARSRTSGTS